MRRYAFAAVLLGTLSVPALAQIDGTVGALEGYTRYATQNNETGFGNNANELDALYAKHSGNTWDLAITGNIVNGNSYLLFFDTAAGGSQTLNATAGPGYLQGQKGLKFDADFAPEYALALNRSGNTIFYDLVDLGTNTAAFLGNHDVDTNTPAVLGNGLTAAFNNSNILGVSDVSGLGGETALTGLELELAGGTFNLPSSFKVAALITNNGDGFASNQVLGGLGGGVGNLAFGINGSSGNSTIDFSAIGGNQFAVVPAPSSALALLMGVPMIGVALRRRKK